MPPQALARYYAILDGDERAHYLESKRLSSDLDLRADTGRLWDTHKSMLNGRTSVPGRTSLLQLKGELGRRMLEHCALCERKCGANRRAGEKGHCGVLDARISTDFLHMGEEPDLVPSYTIFFTGCTFNCVFCQNWDISTRPDTGTTIDSKTVARMIEGKFQPPGGRRHVDPSGRARNVNWVGGDPTSNLPFILEVLLECSANIPQVWNSNMYLSDEGMRLLDGIVDVYLTDFKYGNNRCALRLSNAENYMEVICRNHVTARRNGEMIIRHLVLPGHVKCCTEPALKWISENLESVLVNLMAQYRPEHRAKEFPDLAKALRMSEYNEALEIAENFGLELCD